MGREFPFIDAGANGLGRAGKAALLATVVLFSTPLASAAQDAQTGDVSGVWWITQYSPRLALQGTNEIPYTDEARALYERNIAGLQDGSVVDEARFHCTPDGLPRVLGNPYPFKIIHTPGQTSIVYELNHNFRVVEMDKPQMSPDDLEIYPYYYGHSVGHWEGDTLVVETAGFNEKTFLDATGAPHSYLMTVVERLRKLSDTQLEDVATIEDPLMLTAPITVRYVYDLHPEIELETYVCGEPHRDISQVPGVTEARRARGD